MPVTIPALMVEKKVKGRKRHIVVDTLGCLLAIVVHAANKHDTKGGILVAGRAFDKYPTIEKFCGDEGYRGAFVEYIRWDFDDVGVDISTRIKPEFEILPKRWIVERTFAWVILVAYLRTMKSPLTRLRTWLLSLICIHS